MSNTSPEPDTQATPMAGNDDSAEKYGAMNSNAEGFEGESPEAKQAKAEALAHARAARAARAKYARLVSQQGGANPNPNNKMHAESMGDLMAAQSNRTGGAEWSLAASRVIDQLHRGFVEVRAPEPRVKAGLSALATWLPLAALRPPKRRHGIGALVSDPRWLSLGGAVVFAVAETIDTDRRQKEQAKGQPPQDGQQQMLEESSRRPTAPQSEMARGDGESKKAQSSARTRKPKAGTHS
jgi:hypothetical protein